MNRGFRPPRAFVRMAGLCASMLLTGASAHAQANDAPTIAFGRNVAQRFCGQCHGLGADPSPFADAPSFGDLHKRYRRGGLDELLKEGMLTPDPSMEEGNMPGHPRMPQRKLDVDERAALTAYLRSLEPPKAPKLPRVRGARRT